jgi:hypothetical protein
MSSPVPIPRRRAGQRVRTIALQAEKLPDGSMRISSPHARGWAGIARNSIELARVFEQAFAEVAVASYARQRGRAYDLDQLTSYVPGDSLAGTPQRRTRGAAARRAAHPVEAWSMTDNGCWRSPAGRTYQPDSKMVANVLKRRAERGLPPVDTPGLAG